MLKLEALETRCLLSVSVTDSYVPNDDFEISFPETLTGWSSAPEQISIFNGGNQPLTITKFSLNPDSDMAVSDANFTLEYPASIQTPPGFSSSTETFSPLPLNSIITDLIEVINDQDWYVLEATANQVIDIQSNAFITVYSVYGNQINTHLEGVSDTLITPYTGEYYVRVSGMGDTGEYTIAALTTKEVVKPLSTNLPSNGFLTTSQGDDEAWFSFDGNYGDLISLDLNTNAPTESNIELTVFNQLGDTVFSQDELTRNTLEFPIFGDGAYYVRLVSYTNTSSGVYKGNNSYSVTLGESDSIFTLQPNSTLNVPIWFMPSQAGEREGYFSLEIDTNLNNQIDLDEQFKISLYGSGVTGDMSPSEIHLPELPFDLYAQSGTSLQVEVTVENVGDGNIIDYPNIQFVLSLDNILDAGDTALTSTLLNDSTVTPLTALAGDTFTVLSEVEIPAGLDGQYYLFATVNPDRAIDETNYTNNTAVLEPLFIDPYDIIVYDNTNVVYDYSIDFGNFTIGNTTPPNQNFIGVYNRGDSAITVNVIDLNETDNNFVLNTDELSGIPVQPGEHRAIWVQFSPQEFGDGADPATLTDSVIIKSANAEYHVTLTGTIQGPDLHVLESSNIANDDKLEFGSVQVGSTATQEFLLANLGNQDLVVNDILMPAPFKLSAASQALIGSGVTLKANENVTLSVEYFPTVINTNHATLTIDSSDESQFYSYTLALEGNSVDPALVISETAGVVDDNQLNFGNRTIANQTTTQAVETMTLTNSGNGIMKFNSDLAIDSLNDQYIIADMRLIDSNGIATDITDITMVELLPGEVNRLEVDVQFLATMEGFSSGKLTIDTDFAGSHEVLLSGFALNTAITVRDSQGQSLTDTLTFNPVTITYANPQPQTSRIFSVVNTGTSNLTIYSVFIEGEGFGIGNPNATDIGIPGGYDLEPGESLAFKCVFVVPTPIAGDYSGSLIINYNLPNQRTIQLDSVALTPEIDITLSDGTYPQTIDFGVTDMGQSQTIPVTISNADGTAPLHISWTSEDNQFSLGTQTSYIIAAGHTETINLYYDPSVTGTSDSLFTIYSDDLNENINTFTVSGTSQGQPLQEVSKGKSLPFFDADGNRVLISLNEGTAKVYLNEGATNYADIALIELLGTTEKSTLTIKSDGDVTIGSIMTLDSGSLKSIKAPNLSLNNNINISGSLASLYLNDIAEGASIAIGNSPSSKPMTIKADRIGTDLNHDDVIDHVLFSINGDIKSFQATEFLSDHNGEAVDNLTANSLKKLTIKRGDLTGSVKTSESIGSVSVYGEISGNLTGSDIGSVKTRLGGINGDISASSGSIKSVSAGKDISGFLMASQDIGKISSKGMLDGALRAQNIKSIKAESLESAVISVTDYLGSVSIKTDIIDSYVLAGYDIGLSVESATDDGDLTAGEIKSIKFGGEFKASYVTAGVMTETIYNDLYSLLPSGAEYINNGGKIGSVSGKAVQRTNNGVEFGFYVSGDTSRIKLDDSSDTDDFVIKTVMNTLA